MSWLVTFGETMGLCTSRGVGPLHHGAGLQLSFGGTESNVAIGLSRLGIPAVWSGRTGDDDLGRLIRKGLRGEGVDVSHATVDPDRPTGLMVKFRPRYDRTSVIYYRKHAAASALTAAHVPRDAIARAGVLHLSGISPALGEGPREAVLAAIAHARACGTRVSLDLNFRAQLWEDGEAEPVLRDLISRADSVLLGRRESHLLYGDLPAKEVAAELAENGARNVVVKLGAEGAVAGIDGDLYAVPGWPATIVDPVGAGDGFAAGYLSGLHDGLDPVRTVERGLAVAAVVVSTYGDWEGMPTRAELPPARHTDHVVER